VDAYTLVLTWLSRRELSIHQVRERLSRRHLPPEEIEQAIQRLVADRTLDDRRVAIAAARTDTAVRRRGRRRVLEHLRQLGIDRSTADAALQEVFGDLDENALLDAALERALRGRPAQTMDRTGTARVVRRLIGQGFEPGAVYARLRRRGAETDE
jgi:regulatory protein